MPSSHKSTPQVHFQIQLLAWAASHIVVVFPGVCCGETANSEPRILGVHRYPVLLTNAVFSSIFKIFHFCPGESNFGCSSACQPFLSKRLKWLRLEFEQVGEGQDGFKATGVKNMNVELGAMASERSLRAAV